MHVKGTPWGTRPNASLPGPKYATLLLEHTLALHEACYQAVPRRKVKLFLACLQCASLDLCMPGALLFSETRVVSKKGKWSWCAKHNFAPPAPECSAPLSSPQTFPVLLLLTYLFQWGFFTPLSCVGLPAICTGGPSSTDSGAAFTPASHLLSVYDGGLWYLPPICFSGAHWTTMLCRWCFSILRGFHSQNHCGCQKQSIIKCSDPQSTSWAQSLGAFRRSSEGPPAVSLKTLMDQIHQYQIHK